ncbi:hypothetical protein Tco_0420749, partial [Tanacetum coccineum]
GLVGVFKWQSTQTLSYDSVFDYSLLLNHYDNAMPNTPVNMEGKSSNGAAEVRGTSTADLTTITSLLPSRPIDTPPYIAGEVNLMMKLFRSDDKFSQMLTQYESTTEFGSGSGGCGDDEIADDQDGGEDEEDGDSCDVFG